MSDGKRPPQVPKTKSPPPTESTEPPKPKQIFVGDVPEKIMKELTRELYESKAIDDIIQKLVVRASNSTRRREEQNKLLFDHLNISVESRTGKQYSIDHNNATLVELVPETPEELLKRVNQFKIKDDIAPARKEYIPHDNPDKGDKMETVAAEENPKGKNPPSENPMTSKEVTTPKFTKKGDQ